MDRNSINLWRQRHRPGIWTRSWQSCGTRVKSSIMCSHQGRIRELPSRKALMESWMVCAPSCFRRHYGRSDLNESNIDFFVGDQLHLTLGHVAGSSSQRTPLHIGTGRAGRGPLDPESIDITSNFAAQLPTIRARLFTDLQAAYQGDPAATSPSEILLCYPGMTAVIYYRFAHALYRLGARLPRA